MKDLAELLTGHEVRLFSAVNIGTEREAEIRATASLLSMVKAVSEFGRLFVKTAGGPTGKIECFTEVTFKDKAKNKESRPDGIIVVTRGKMKWKAFIEVKVGSNGLKQEQFDRYHVLAREQKFDALITISNQAALSNGLPPIKVDKRRLNGTPVVHLSWERLLSEAQYLSWQSGVEDKDQQYMLAEWIKYVDDSKAKIVVAPQLQSNWSDILSAASADRLTTVRKDIEDFVSIWCGFLRVEAFRLRALLGEKVEVRLKSKEKSDPDMLAKKLVAELLDDNKVQSSLVIPHTAGDLEVLVDLRSKRVFFEVHIDPPQDKKAKGQITWIVNQLKKLGETPPELSIIVDWKKKGVMSKALVAKIEEMKEGLWFDMEKHKIPN